MLNERTVTVLTSTPGGEMYFPLEKICVENMCEGSDYMDMSSSEATTLRRPPAVRFIERRPILAAIILWIADVILSISVQLSIKTLFPGAQADYLALFPLVLVPVLLLTWLGWWHEAGFNSPSAWRNLALLWLPALLVLVLPLVRGLKPVDVGTLATLSLGYLLVGFREESLYRGLMLRMLQPIGPVRAVILAGVLFGAAHLGNFFIRSSPALVMAQIVGATCFGIAMGALRLRTGTIWFLILIHALSDLFLRYTLLPAIPLEVARDIVLLIYGIYLLRLLHREHAQRAHTSDSASLPVTVAPPPASLSQ
jgi:uncharacterized protein